MTLLGSKSASIGIWVHISTRIQRFLLELTEYISITVSCQRVDVNLDALGEEKVIFPQGKVMTLHQTLDTGFEYEVGVRLAIPDMKTLP